MADYRAIATVCSSIVQVLSTSDRPEALDHPLSFDVYLPGDFLHPMTAGVSLFLYRITPNGYVRTPVGRVGPDGRRYKTQLPIDIHFLLTAWAPGASLQHALAGWMMRILEETPILTAALLNSEEESEVFRPDEAVEIALMEMTTEEMFRIWQVLPEDKYQLSIPYLARNVRIESTLQEPGSGTVQERVFDYQELTRPST